MTNITGILEKLAEVAAAVPFAALAGALLQVFNIAMHLVAKTPLPDVVIQLIPGFGGPGQGG